MMCAGDCDSSGEETYGACGMLCKFELWGVWDYH